MWLPASRSHRFAPGKEYPVPTEQEDRWAPERPGNCVENKNLTPAVQGVARSYTDWAIPTLICKA
jgi:hypothetical protein